MRVIGYHATLCFHCAMITLNLEALGDRTCEWTCRSSYSGDCGMDRCTTRQKGDPMGRTRKLTYWAVLSIQKFEDATPACVLESGRTIFAKVPHATSVHPKPNDVQ